VNDFGFREHESLMLMFTETEIIRLRMLVEVSHPSQCALDDFHPPCRANWSSQTLRVTITPTLLPATSVYTIPHLSCLHFRDPKLRIFGSQQVCQPRSFGLNNQVSSTIGEHPLLTSRFPLNLELVVATATFVCGIEGSVWLYSPY
jgi:hypothetical protein